MSDFIEIQINCRSQQQKEMLIGLLTVHGFEGFEEAQNLLSAYIPAQAYDEVNVKTVMAHFKLTYSQALIPQTNWNALWEAGFEPVVIVGVCSIRAAFHAPVATTPYDIIITPKMSFGTGHHATTYMMIVALQNYIIDGRSVADFGTGTGVLAILAEKMGALQIDAIDNDDWSIENGRENIRMNDCHHIRLFKADSLDGCGIYDFILANINRHVLLANMPSMKAHLSADGVIILSGILTGDVEEVTRTAAATGLYPINMHQRGDWACMELHQVKD